MRRHPNPAPRLLAPHLTRRDLLRLTALVTGGALTGALNRRRARAAAGDVRDVVVVGGGMSGLMASWLLSDHDVLLLEGEEEPGGRICAGEWNGLTYSMGAAYTGRPDLEMLAFYAELGVESIPVPPPVDGMALGGALYPEDHFASALGSQEVLDDFAKLAGEFKRLNDLGVEEAVYSLDLPRLERMDTLDRFHLQTWLNSLDIDPLLHRYVDVESRGLFGVAPKDFSLLFAIPELTYNFYSPGIERERIPSGPVPDFHTHRPRSSVFGVDTWTFRTGMMELVRGMTGQPGLSGRVETGARVTRVKVNRDRTVTVTYRQDGSTKTVTAHAAVLATPAPVTADIVAGGLSDDVMTALRSVEYTTYVTLALFTRERLFRNAWNIACLDGSFTTLNDAVRTQVAPDHTGESILGVAMPPVHARDRSLFEASDDEVVRRAMPDIERYLPGAGDKVLGRDIKRFEHAFPVFGPGYGKVLATLHNDPSARGPLFLAGDYTVYPTLGGASVSGELADRRVRAYAETLE